MNKDTYILLKDLPYVKAGTEYISADDYNVGDKCSYVPSIRGMKHSRFAIHIDWIKDNPEWFGKMVHPQATPSEKPKEKDVFIWNDTLVKEYDAMYYHWEEGKPPKIEYFKQSKSTPKEDKIEVDIRRSMWENMKHHVSDKGYYYEYTLEVYHKKIPPEKYEAVKNAVEYVLNREPSEDDKLRIMFTYNGVPYSLEYPLRSWAEWIDSMINYKRLYTEKELLEAEQKAFYAAKETLPFPEYQRDVADIPHSKVKYPDKYKTFEDYKNQTLNQ